MNQQTRYVTAPYQIGNIAISGYVTIIIVQ